MSSLAGKTALVTGASGALGSTMCSALQEQGATVAGTYRSAGSAEGAASVSLAVVCDVTEEDSVRTCFERVRAELGGPDIVVHCAGGYASDGMLLDTSSKTWNTMMAMNLTSGFLVMREALRSMDEASYGRIILVSAMSALVSGPGAGAYRVSKAGLRTLVETAHTERRGRGIAVNALAPGTIDTKQNRKDMPDADHTDWVRPEALAQTVVHLCSDAGGAISGDIIPFP